MDIDKRNQQCIGVGHNDKGHVHLVETCLINDYFAVFVMAFYFTNSHFHCWFSMLHLIEKHIHLLDVQEVVGGDPAPGVGVPLLQPVLEHALLSPDLLMRSLAPALAEQSAHVC